MPINPKLVHVYALLDPVEGRPEGAWVFHYHNESFVTDPGGGNPAPLAWTDQPHRVLDFDVKTRDEIAGVLRINPAKLGLVVRTDATFPAPILEFRDGPIWSADAIEAWAPTPSPTPVPGRDRSLPRI
jgi:hypothetical protein